MLAAEQVELERMSSSLAASAAACEAPPAADSNSTGGPFACPLVERRAIASLRRAISLELETRLRITDETQLKRQYACLWKHRAQPLAAAVAKVIASAADTPSDTADDAGPLGALVTKVRNDGLPRSADGSVLFSAARANHTARLLELCTALTAPELAKSSVRLRTCLCKEAEEAKALASEAAATAQTRAAAVASAARAASQRALDAAEQRAAAHKAAREAAKERLFRRLQARPEFARLVTDAMT